MDNRTVDITRSQEKALFKISWSYRYKSGEEVIYTQELYDEVIRKNQIVVCDEIGLSSFQKSVTIDDKDATVHTATVTMRQLIKKGDCFILSETPNAKTKNQVRYFNSCIFV